MATQKPISTISYNSEGFLREKLNSWVDAHIIQAYMYIPHKGEDGDKDHIHVRLEPNKRLDPMDLQEALKEYVAGEKKPRGVRPFRPSSEEDWILYAVHDADYLRSKYSGGDTHEKLPYSWEDIRASEGYDVEIAYIRARSKLDHTAGNMAARMQAGENALAMIMAGENPYTVNAIMRAMQGSDYERISRENQSLQDRLWDLEAAISRAGYYVGVDEFGATQIRPIWELEVDRK